ncbi:NOTCH2 [Mytilus edulis]|uniref:NOTCH2 n=1 Tax=Mytilus edulis TaxID=6550 RepID=A0A8S3SQU3_MYTED|nr:NOTCH2 [Mytilus edulis]
MDGRLINEEVDGRLLNEEVVVESLDTDSCWPTNPCQEDTRCLPTHSNGHACLTYVTSCTASPCINGHCNITNAGYTCTCDAGYTGVNCEINPCMPNPCRNGGTCTNGGWNTHKCACISNTGGSNCQYSCDSNWKLNGGTCYYFTNELYTWQTGQSYCNGFGKLAEPDTSVEISFLKSRATEIGSRGTDSVTEGTFMWASSNKVITTTDWDTGQPDNHQGGQDCLCMGSTFNYRWDDTDCATKHRYICERPYV